MSEQTNLRARKREETGSGPAGRLREEGWIPGIMYGHGVDSDAVKVPEQELNALLEEISVDNTLVDLEVEGEDGAVPVLIREVQRHPWKRDVLHVDFFRIRSDEKIRVEVPIHLVGTPEGVSSSGGILQQNRHEIEIECLPDEIPEFFELDVTQLEIGDSLHVADLNTGGVRPLEELDLTLCTVVPPSIVEVEEEEPEEEEELLLEEMEPELIGEAEEGEEPPEAAEMEAEEEEDGERP